MQRVATQTEWRGQRDTTRARLWRVLALSVLLHVPFTPVAALAGLVGLLLDRKETDLPPVDAVTAIPVDLVSDETPANEPPRQEQPPAAEPKAPESDPFADLDKNDDDGEPVARTPRDAGAPHDAGPKDAGPAIGDPVAMAGAAGRVVDQNANVRLLVFSDRMRNHPLGTRVGQLLGSAAQWQDFFGPSGLDPVKDVDRILIAGPQLKNSSEVVAVLRVNVPQDKLKQALTSLVDSDPQGAWIDAKVPAARTHADRAERIIVLPAPGIVVVTPPSAEKHALSLGPGLRFPNPRGNEALTTYVVTPWRAFVGIPFEVPKSLRWARMKIIPTSDGGATAEVVAEDESEESAKTHAKELTESINKVTELALPSLSIGGLSLGGTVRLLEPVEFRAVGKEVHGTVVATAKQLSRLLEAVSAYAKDLAEQAEKKRKTRAADAGSDAGGTPSPGASAADGAAPKADAAPERDAGPERSGAARPDAGFSGTPVENNALPAKRPKLEEQR